MSISDFGMDVPAAQQGGADSDSRNFTEPMEIYLKINAKKATAAWTQKMPKRKLTRRLLCVITSASAASGRKICRRLLI
jgi:hypothetical protein